jgi:hypothetical protein
MRCLIQKLGAARLLEMLDPSMHGGWGEETDMSLRGEETDCEETAGAFSWQRVSAGSMEFITPCPP